MFISEIDCDNSAFSITVVDLSYSNGVSLKKVDKFCYLGDMLMQIEGVIKQ